ncbi:formylglycine-generating enzyme family protein [Piscinibacter sp.]|uniref:formylglycine-generating enzyme family protein n=1 Tax=Piscinibacter sp. TaxID=1903157 RepID=UPI002D0549DD|nr:SUMF1/EgtB/PvdO family nonheme iron enzyme [Albitalea sp.]HUG26027.1 SUMF1/EgtB/PvdO family nonheme iron enzyme [Albitalea sp.]
MHFLFLAGAAALSASAQGTPAGPYEFDAEFVAVQPDTHVELKIDRCMAPSTTYEISRYEVTNTEYAAFLNAVASEEDPFRLYSPLQRQHFWGGISRSNAGPVASYSVKKGYEDLPVTFVSWFDAARYANWLHYGRPTTGTSGIGSTEGTATQGAYDTSGFHAAKPSRRNREARYFIPTCGEWLYAGFYDPATKAMTRYAGGNSLPDAGPPHPAARTANYYSTGWALPYPHLASVRDYRNNASAFGTLNQAGNVMEWVETDGKMALGGSLFLPADTLALNYRDEEHPAKKLSSFGFRIGRQAGLAPGLSLTFSAHRMLDTQAQVALAVTVPRPSPAMAPEWKRIDHAGNVSDVKTGRGCVPYAYEISRTEITNAEYADFLNAVAADHDRSGLYVDDMGTGVAGGLIRLDRNGRHVYEPKPGFDHRPVTYLSWFSLARYANWLHYGRPSGSQVIGVTEGDRQRGAYDTSAFASHRRDGSGVGISRHTFSRNERAKYFIPSDDEWYKAAYHDPDRPGWRKYWNYPTRSDVAPSNTRSQGANFQRETLGEGPPHYVSEAGAYRGSSYYGVHDLGGNVWEWLEDWRSLGGGTCWRCDIPTKGLRGGSFNYIEVGLRNGNIDPGAPTDHYFVYGGRIARRSVDSTGGPASTGWCSNPRLRHLAASLLNKAWGERKLIVAGSALAASVGLVMVVWRARSKRRR